MLDWQQCPAVERIPGKVTGESLFKGTRVPVKALFENLESAATIDDFLEWFPGVTRQQVEAVLQHAERSLIEANGQKPDQQNLTGRRLAILVLPTTSTWQTLWLNWNSVMSRSRGAAVHPESLTILRTSNGAPQLRQLVAPGRFCPWHHWHTMRCCSIALPEN